MKKQPLLWMTIAAALLSGCTGHREHHPQVTFTVDTVRTDTTASNPICLAEKYGSLLNGVRLENGKYPTLRLFFIQ
ncbi:hypothetical protein ACVC9J_003958 [Salmonella enterica subsp. enterica serovar Chester]